MRTEHTAVTSLTEAGLGSVHEAAAALTLAWPVHGHHFLLIWPNSSITAEGNKSRFALAQCPFESESIWSVWPKQIRRQIKRTAHKLDHSPDGNSEYASRSVH